MFCAICGIHPVPPKSRSYCAACRDGASARWKRRQRQVWKQSGQKYWRDNWKHKSDQERRAYYRAYMRAYRRRRRQERAAGESSLAGKQPLDALTIPARDSEQDLGPDLAVPFFVPGQLPLANAQRAGEVVLGCIKTAQLPEAPSHGLPVNCRLLRWRAHADFS
jgi:hypothetical protein